MIKFPTLRHNKAFFKTFRPEVEAFIGRQLNGNGLSCADFPGDVKIKLCDGSKMTFKDAFYVTKPDEDTDGVYAVFTEHCGYHLFYGEEVTKITYTQNPPPVSGLEISNSDGSIDGKAYKAAIKQAKKELKSFKPIVIVNGVQQ